MRIMIVVPQGTVVPTLGEEVVVKEVPRDRPVAFDFLPPEGRFVMVPRPQQVASLAQLVAEARALPSEQIAVAFVPQGQDEGAVLATATAAYAFDAQKLHLAGGLDATIPFDAMCLETMIRLAGRTYQPCTVACSAVKERATFDVPTYLMAIGRNFDATTQTRYLTPLVMATVLAPLHDSGIDPYALDLQRTPYDPQALTYMSLYGADEGEDGGPEVPVLSAPKGAFSGAQAIREWLDNVGGMTIGRAFITRFRRLPDARLAGVEEFFDEAIRATGLADERIALLKASFAELAANAPCPLAFVISDKPQAFARMQAIRTQVEGPALYAIEGTETAFESAGPTDAWHACSRAASDCMREATVIYLVDSSARAFIDLKNSPSILIADYSCTDIVASLQEDALIPALPVPSIGFGITALNETFLRADRIIAADDEQRDFLLGALVGLGRLNQYTYDEDFSLGSLVQIEEGTVTALLAIEKGAHPFDTVYSANEWEQTPFDAAVPPEPEPAEEAPKADPSLTQRAKNKLRRLFSEKGHRS